MNENITPELMKQAETAGSPEEILALAKEHGMELTPEDAQSYYDRFHKTGELADDELDAVSGGGCGRGTEIEECQLMLNTQTCNNCHSMGSIRKGNQTLVGYAVEWIEYCADCGYFERYIGHHPGCSGDLTLSLLRKGIDQKYKKN